MSTRGVVLVLAIAVVAVPAWADHDWNPNTVTGAVSDGTIAPCTVDRTVSGSTGGTPTVNEFAHYEFQATAGQAYFFSVAAGDGGSNVGADMWAFDDSLTSGSNNNSGLLSPNGSEAITVTANTTGLHLIKVDAQQNVGPYTMVYRADGVTCQQVPTMPMLALVLTLVALLVISVGMMTRKTLTLAP